LDERLFAVSVRAPFTFPFGGYTWYDLTETGVPDRPMFGQSYEQLMSLIRTIPSLYPVDTERLFLLGFSMGSMMAFALSLTAPWLFRGVAAHSGYVPEESGLSMRWSELSGVSFFLAHGTFDQVIPVGLARRAESLFRESNARWVYREYPIGHEISQESLGDMAVWLHEELEKGKSTTHAQG
jgi:phospholipase/carboxylesterase